MPPFLVVALLFRVNLLLGVLGYAVAVVDSTGRNPELVGTSVVVLVVVVVEKDCIKIMVLVTT